MRSLATPVFKLTSVFGLLFLLALTSNAQTPRDARGAQDARHQAGVLQVKLTPVVQSQLDLRTSGAAVSTSVPSLDQLNTQFGAVQMRRLFRPAGKHEARHVQWGLDRWYVIEFGGPTDAAAARAAYAASGAVETAELKLEKVLHGQRVLDDPPNDPLYGQQWHYDNDGALTPAALADADIDATEAWAIETGHPDVVVQIVDSGIDSDHPDLVDALWVNAGEDLNGNGRFDNAPAAEGGDLNGVDDDNNGFVDDIIGYGHADDVSIPEAGPDSEGGSGSHGVHTAGTVGARTNNGVGVAGVAGGDGTPESGVRLMISQTFGNDAVDGFAEAIVYGADNGAVISNNSWGYGAPGAFEQAVLDAIDYFVANAGGEGAPVDGGLFVASAGNDGTDDEWYPGFYEPALAVSSLGIDNSRSEFNSSGSSNFGLWVDVAGPGGDFFSNSNIEELVLSTVIQGEAGNAPAFGFEYEDYDWFQGTSMSGPHVAGIAALVASYEHRRGTTLSADDLRARVASPNTTKDIDQFNPGFEGQLGVGLASAFLAITNPPGDATAPNAVDDLAVDDVIGNAVVLSFTVPEDPEGVPEDAISMLRVTGIDLRYSTEPITEANFADATPAELDFEDTFPAEGDTITVTIENLSFTETYYFAVRTNDRFLNESALSNVVEVTTGDAPFSVTPTDFDVTLESGEETDRTLTITNESARNVAFNVEIVGAAAAEVEFVPPGLYGEKLERWEAANVRAWSGDYPRGDGAGDPHAVDPKSQSLSADRPAAAPALLAALTNIPAASFDLFELEYGTFDLGTPSDWDVLNATATEVWAADYVRGVDDRIFGYRFSDDVFGSLDPTTGDFTVIGDGWDHTGFPLDLSGDLTTGDLYAYSSADSLYRVDRFTGETELVTAVADPGGINAVAFDDMGVLYGHDVVNDQIVTISLEDGSVEVVGPTGFDANFIQGMDFDPTSGRLYLSAYNVGVPFGERAELRVASRETGNTTLVGKINGDGFGEYPFLAIPGEGFVTTNLIEVTLRPGRSVDVDVTFDASLLLAGDYTAALRVVAEGLPGEPTVDVPVTLEVTGDPVVAVAPDSLDFGDVFVNDDATLQVEVRNDGVDDLEVSGLTASGGPFEVLGTAEGETAFTLEPGEATAVFVQFAPTELGEFEGTLTVASNDPENAAATVTLLGEGIPAPEIVVSATEFDLQAFQGQTYTREFTISNTGGSPLVYQILEQDVEPEVSEPVVAFDEGFDEGFPEDWIVVTNGDPDVPWQLASDYGSPVDPNYAGTGDAAMANSDVGQFIGDPAYDTELWTPEITLDRDDYQLEFLLNFNALGANNFLDVDYTLDGGETWTNMVQYTEDVCEGSCFGTPSGRLIQIPLDTFIEADQPFHVRWHYYTTDETSWDWWATLDEVSIVRNVEWLAVDPNGGEIAPGESETVTLTIDADLPPGEYGTELLVASNDPLSNGEFIDISLTVVGSVTVAPEPGEGDLEVNPNEEFLVPITVASLQDLGVESYQFTLAFDEDLLEPLGIETEGTLSEGTATSVNTSVEGEISVAVAEQAGMESAGAAPTLFTIRPLDIEGENPVLLYVRFRAGEVLGETDLEFTSFQFNEGEPPVAAEAGSVAVVPLYGDPSLNLEVSAFDASLVLDYVVDAVELNEAAQEAADVSGNGAVSALDASLILRFAAGDPEVPCFPAAPSCGAEGDGEVVAQAALRAGPSATGALAWGSAAALGADAALAAGLGDADGLVRIPLELAAGGSVRSVEIEVPVNEALATVASVETSAPEGWLVAHHVGDGVLRIAMSGATPLPSGPVAEVVLRRHGSAAALDLAGYARVGEAEAVELASVSAEPLPVEFALHGAWPNPSAGSAQIALDLPTAAEVRVEVFDAIGRRVHLIEGTFQAGARRTVSLGANALPSGVYVYRVTAETETGTEGAAGRMTVVR
jgi:subtilisin family serine protease